ncbi:MAG: hypothetical protein M3R17_14160 [Bacteroidota bacterium]|nr:hypothetical protein [Bacteroidota bacterium]
MNPEYQTPEDIKILKQELATLYGLVEIKCNYLNDEHRPAFAIFVNKSKDDKNLNVELNGHTLTFSHEILYTDTTRNSFLRITIYNCRFNREGNYLDERGIPVFREPKDVDLKSVECHFVIHPEAGVGWSVAPEHIKFITSRMLIDEWFETFLGITVFGEKTTD